MTLEWIARNAVGLLAVVAAFGFIIFIHEMGHFLVARRVGIRCPNFAIGFGPPLFSFRWRATEFSVRLFPFGGYVLMVGEDPGSQDSWHSQLEHFLSEVPLPARPAQLLEYLGELEKTKADTVESDRQRFEEVREHVLYLEDRVYASLDDLEGNFNHKTIPQRIAVVAGGVTMNLIAALLLYWGVGLTWGMGQVAPVAEPVVVSVLTGGPAAGAGIKPGDRVVRIGEANIVSGPQMIEVIGNYPAVPVDVTVERKGAPVKVRLTPDVWMGGIYGFQSVGGGLELKTVPQSEQAVRPGDAVTAVNGEPVASMQDLARVLGELSEHVGSGNEDVPVRLQVKGKGEVTLQVPARHVKPLGKMGISPATVLQIHLVSGASSEVVAVQPGSPAEAAGLKVGDVIELVNGRQVLSQPEIDSALGQLQGEKVTLSVGRAGEREDLTLASSPASVAALGVTLQPITPGLVVGEGLVFIGRAVTSPIRAIYQLASSMLTIQEVKDTSGGPLMIMQMIFELSDNGWGQFLFFLALINALVGAFNLMPFPALDGSRLLLLVVSAVRRKEFDPDKEARVHFVGLMVLLTLVLVLTFNDVQRWWSGTPLTR